MMFIFEQVFNAKFNIVSFQEFDVLLLTRSCFVVLFLVSNITLHRFNPRIAHRERPISLRGKHDVICQLRETSHLFFSLLSPLRGFASWLIRICGLTPAAKCCRGYRR